MVRYLKAFMEGTVKGVLVGVVAGFLGFSMIGFLLYYNGVESEWLEIATNGAKVFGTLGLLGGGLASCLHLARVGGSENEEPNL